MEYDWERTIPFLKLDIKKVGKLFEGILDEKDIVKLIPINEGCRTTNYIVETWDKKYSLKIFASDDDSYNREYKLLNMLREKISVQKIYKISTDDIIDGKKYIIYEYINGITLGQALKNGYILEESFVRQVARALGEIHKFKFNKVGFLDENLNVIKKLPSISKYYELFINEKVRERLGNDTVTNIINIVKENEDDLLKLDYSPRLVHGDFQGTNILINKGKLAGILDWEFVMAGHPLGDIGQFFRYNEHFNNYLIKVFENEYNKSSDYELMNNWYKISRLRDLINLIQLISADEEMPNKYKNIKDIIIRDIRYLYIK